METDVVNLTRSRTAACASARCRWEAGPARRGSRDARRFRRRGLRLHRHRGRLWRRRRRAHAQAVARTSARRRRHHHEGPLPVTDPGGEGLAPERIRAACDASLRRLGIDTIDLYQIHGPDPRCRSRMSSRRSTSSCAPARSEPSASRTSRRGCSPGPCAPRTPKAGPLRCAPGPVLAGRALGRARAASALPLHRTPRSRRGARSAAASSPDGTRGRRARARQPPGRRPRRRRRGAAPARNRAQLPAGRGDPRHRRRTRRHRPPDRHRLALHQPGVSPPIIGPRTHVQLHDLLPAATLALSDEHLRRLGAHTPPPVVYPHRMLADQDGTDPEQTLRRATTSPDRHVNPATSSAGHQAG